MEQPDPLQLKPSVVGFLCAIFFLFFFAAASAASGWFYTIHIGTYSLDELIPAGNRFNLLYSRLDKNKKDRLRIEMVKTGFHVRIGRFSTEEKAKAVMKDVKTLVSQAYILKQDIKDFDDATMLILHTEDAPPPKKLPDTEEIVVSSDILERETLQISEEEASAAMLNDISVHFYNGEYDKAADLIKKGIKKWPKRAELYAWYGATLLDTGNHDKAYEQYRKAAELVPNVPEYHSGSGYSLLNIYVDRAKRSIAAFEKALEIDPDNVGALEGLGIVYVSIDRKYLANGIYDRLKELDPDAALRLGEYIRYGIEWGK